MFRFHIQIDISIHVIINLQLYNKRREENNLMEHNQWEKTRRLFCLFGFFVPLENFSL